MHPTVATSIFLVTTAYFVLVIAQQSYTPDPYSSNSRYNSQDPYNSDQRYNNQDRYSYNRDRDRYNVNDQDRDRYNQPSGQDRYNQDRDRYGSSGQDRYGAGGQDRYGASGQDRYGAGGQDRYNQDRDRFGAGGGGQDRYNQDRYSPDRYNQNRYNSQDPYNQGGRPYGQQPQYGQGQGGGGGYFDRSGPGGDDGNCCEDFCYRRGFPRAPYLHYATKTAYQFATRQRRDDLFKIPQCTPMAFWGIVKHGARLPSPQVIPKLRGLENTKRQVLMNYEQLQSYPRNGRMCEDDLDLFRRWRWNDSITEDKAYSLSSQGSEDLRILARKLQSSLRPLLDEPYNEQTYKFSYPPSDKIHDSYMAFVEGLFPNSAYRIHADVQQDDVYGSYGSCNSNSYYGSSSSSGSQRGSGQDYWNQRQHGQGSYQQGQGTYQQGQGSYGQGQGSYQQGQGSYQQGQGSYQGGSSWQNQQGGGQYPQGGGSWQSGGSWQGGGSWGQDSDPPEYFRFRQKQEYRDLVHDVSRKLGFKYNLNESVIEDIYDMCRFEKAWYPREAVTWCAAFSERQLKLLEYGQDLKYYFKYGYGDEQNARKGCRPLRDLRDRFEKAISGGDHEKVVLSFSDTKGLLRLLLNLEVAKDYTPPSAENYAMQSQRKWQTSTLVPFNANLVVVLYQCQQGEPYKVMFALNESPLDIPGCQVGLCDWAILKEKIDNTLRYCNMDCNGASRMQLGYALFPAVALLLYKVL